MNTMNETTRTIAQRIAEAAASFQQRRTGLEPKSVSVVLGGDTLVVTLLGALSPAEQEMSRTPEGAARVQEFHSQLFLDASDSLREDIKRITGKEVREVVAEVEPASGTVVHVFTSGTMVQVFLLSGKVPTESFETITKP
jgi:uncharacterized protein YbcI